MWYRPIPLVGPWVDGAALDVHTRSSTHHVDGYGMDVFDTVRSEIGEMLHLAKYERDRGAAARLAAIAVEFLRAQTWLPLIEMITPAPSSAPHLRWIATAIGAALALPVNNAAIRRGGPMDQLAKHLASAQARRRALAFRSVPAIVRGKTLLVLDDLIRSGDTLRTIVEAALNEGEAAAAYVLTFTKTRTASGMGK
jgi:predicted amidophosphoribosyltransferase